MKHLPASYALLFYLQPKALSEKLASLRNAMGVSADQNAVVDQIRSVCAATRFDKGKIRDVLFVGMPKGQSAQRLTQSSLALGTSETFLYLATLLNPDRLSGINKGSLPVGGWLQKVFDVTARAGLTVDDWKAAFDLELGSLANVDEKYFKHKQPLWNLNIDHTTYDEVWQSRAIWRHLKNIRCAVLTVGGWFDAEDLMGPLRVYRTIKSDNPGIANSLVMGPWVHGGWASDEGRRLGNVDFAAETAEFYRQNILLPFFEFHLKDKGDPQLPEASVFETGTNVWRQYPAWPAPGAKIQTLYFREAGRLGGLKGGRKGGLAVKAERGVEFYQEIGRLGGQRVRDLIAAGLKATERQRKSHKLSLKRD